MARASVDVQTDINNTYRIWMTKSIRVMLRYKILKQGLRSLKMKKIL